jgi:hypothetical protein
MKIYINHFNLCILPDILKTLSKYKIHSEEYWQIYSSEGIYLVDNNSTIKLNPVDHDIVILKEFYEDFTLIVDPSFFIVEKVVQLPSEHVSIKVKRDIFNLNETTNTIIKNKNSIKLVIESEEVKKPNTIENNEFEYLPKDIYFELPNGSDIKNDLVKEELIVFLSLLK